MAFNAVSSSSTPRLQLVPSKLWIYHCGKTTFPKLQLKAPATAFLRHCSLSQTQNNVQALPSILTALEAALHAQFPKDPASPEQHHHNAAIAACTPKLASYLFFPFSQFLQLNPPTILQGHQAIFSHVLRLLGLLVSIAGNKLEKGIREQIWTFGALTLGGPLGSRELPREWGKEVREAAAGLLGAIIQSDIPAQPDAPEGTQKTPISVPTGPFQRPMESLTPQSEQDQAKTAKPKFELSIPSSIIAHTVSSLLLLLEDTEHTSRLSALAALQAIIQVRLVPSDEMPASLPGTVSTLCKAITATKGNTEVTIQALECLKDAVIGCMSDDRSRRLRLIDEGEAKMEQDAPAQSLEELLSGSALLSSGTSRQAETNVNQLAHISETEEKLSSSPTVDSHSSPSSHVHPGHSQAWLRATSSQLHRAFVSLLPILRSRSSASVRAAFADLCGTWLSTSRHSLATSPPALPRLLQEELLVLSCDDWKEVSSLANGNLAAHTGHEGYADVAREGLASLAGSMFSYGLANEVSLHRELQIITGAAKRSGSDLSGKSLKVERWSRSLLKALEMVPIDPGKGGSQQNRDASAPWLRTNQSSLFLEAGPAAQAPLNGALQDKSSGSEHSKAPLSPFPASRFANLAPGKSVNLLSDALKAVSEASNRASGDISLIEHFLALAGSPDYVAQGSAQTASAIWVASQLVDGLDAGAASRQKERLVKDIVAIAQAWLEWDPEQERSNTSVHNAGRLPASNGQVSNALLDLEDDDQAIEIRHSPLISSDIVYSKDGTGLSASGNRKGSRSTASFVISIKCLSLQLVGSASRLSGLSFRQHLMHLLYPLLRSLSPPSNSGGLLSAFAYTAIQHISQNCGYSSPASLVISNVDYILNSISARLRGASLGSGAFVGRGGIDPLAPNVLVCTVDLAGEAVLPYLGDAVDEIFDALDRWHAYDLLVSELLRVLDVLVNTCVLPTTFETAREITANEPMQKSLDAQPDSARDLSEFEAWFRSRHDKRRELERDQKDEAERFKPVSEYPDHNPQQPFGNLAGTKPTDDFERLDDSAAGQGNDEAASGPEEKEEESKPTRSQVLVLAILRKCLHYVGHPSYFLRARVLALITTCIPLLSDKGSDLLTEVSRLWPYLLARLDDAQRTSHTHTKANQTPAYVTLECIRLIAVLMEHKGDFMHLRIVRDIWPRLRKVLTGLEAPSSSARSSSDQFTTQHRMLRAAITTMRIAVSTVPGLKNEDTWEIAMCFRRFCGRSWDVEIRKEASKLLRALSKVEADMVWLVLAAGTGRTQSLRCLIDSELDDGLVDRLLAEV